MDVNHFNSIKKNKRTSHGRLQKFRVDRVVQYSGRRVLDYGCATGDYVKFLKDHGYSALGVDVLDFTDDWELRGIKHECQVIDGDPASLAKESVDTILLFEVLEHVKDPGAFLEKLKKITKKNIILSVPNCCESALLKGSGLNFNHYTDSSHLQFFNRQSLEELLLDSGFKIDMCETTNQVNLLRPALASIGFSGQILKRLSHLGFKLPEKEYMTLLAVARK